jgi:hypothetical protein
MTHHFISFLSLYHFPKINQKSFYTLTNQIAPPHLILIIIPFSIFFLIKTTPFITFTQLSYLYLINPFLPFTLINPLYNKHHLIHSHLHTHSFTPFPKNFFHFSQFFFSQSLNQKKKNNNKKSKKKGKKKKKNVKRVD